MSACNLTPEDYQRQAQKLLPRGPAWTRDGDAVLSRLLLAAARSFHRAAARACFLAQDANPLYADETFAAREVEAGLPDECTPDGATLPQRRARLIDKWRRRGGQSAAFFEDLAESAGYPGTCVREYEPFTAGSEAGEPLTNDPWTYAFRVGSAEFAITSEFVAGESAAGEPLRDWGNEILECLIGKYKPAHTIALFTYGDDVCA